MSKNRFSKKDNNKSKKASKDTKTTKTKVKDIDLEFRPGDAVQASNYIKLMEALSNQVRQTYSNPAVVVHSVTLSLLTR